MEAKSIRLVIYPSDHTSGSLEVADAMRQVLDLFRLLEKSSTKSDENGAKLLWKLTLATTNSPLTVEAQPFSVELGQQSVVNGYMAARALSHGIEQIIQASTKPEWIDHESEVIIRKIFNRNLNGIGRTDFKIISDTVDLRIDQRSARKGLNYLDKLSQEEQFNKTDWTHKEYGSVEGSLLSTTTHYGKPAILIQSRLTGKKIKCVFANVGDEVSSRIWKDVWSGRRVIVPGVCCYNESGDIQLVHAEDLKPIKSRDVPLEEIYDASFSNGLTPAAHVAALWGEPQ